MLEHQISCQLMFIHFLKLLPKYSEILNRQGRWRGGGAGYAGKRGKVIQQKHTLVGMDLRSTLSKLNTKTKNWAGGARVSSETRVNNCLEMRKLALIEPLQPTYQQQHHAQEGSPGLFNLLRLYPERPSNCDLATYIHSTGSSLQVSPWPQGNEEVTTFIIISFYVKSGSPPPGHSTLVDLLCFTQQLLFFLALHMLVNEEWWRTCPALLRLASVVG